MSFTNERWSGLRNVVGGCRASVDRWVWSGVVRAVGAGRDRIFVAEPAGRMSVS